MMGKLLLFLSLAIFALAILLQLDSNLWKVLNDNLPSTVIRTCTSAIYSFQSLIGNVKRETVFTKEELAKFKGKGGSKIYLAFLGQVFDVSKGKRHYGPGGGYEFFSGIDGTRAFVTGKFDSDGLIDDITGLSESEILGLEGWQLMYHKDYVHVGVVEGAFYKINGEENDMMKYYKRMLIAAKKEQDLIHSDKELFPPCNTEWSQKHGSRVWCSKLSGGIQREWEGVPRMYFKPGSDKPRCACIRQTGPPSHDLSKKDHKNKGDLDNPNLSVYPECKPTSKSCRVTV